MQGVLSKDENNHKMIRVQDVGLFREVILLLW